MPVKRRRKAVTKDSSKAAAAATKKCCPMVTKTFTDNVSADVQVTVGHIIYHLHSQVLRIHSEFFNSSLSERWWRPINDSADTGTMPYRYRISASDGACYLEAAVDPTPAIDPTSVIDLTTSADPIPAAADKDANDDIPAPKHAAKKPKSKQIDIAPLYTVLFAAMYQQRPNPGLGVIKTLDQVELLVELARYYLCPLAYAYCEELVVALDGDDAHGALGSLISKEPVKFLELAITLRSEDIFREAMIHLVGQWGCNEELQTAVALQLSPELVVLVWRTYSELLRTSATIDRGIINFVTRIESPLDNFHFRGSRKYLQARIIQSLSNIYSSGEHTTTEPRFLTRSDIHDQLLSQTLEIGKEAVRMVEDLKSVHDIGGLIVKLQDIPNVIKKSLGEVLKDTECQLKWPGKKGKYEYLTCAKIAREDLPWPV